MWSRVSKAVEKTLLWSDATTYSLGCCIHAHMNGLWKASIARAKLVTLASDALD